MEKNKKDAKEYEIKFRDFKKPIDFKKLEKISSNIIKYYKEEYNKSECQHEELLDKEKNAVWMSN